MLLSVFFVYLLVIAFALLLDRTLGEPKRYHPLILFGHLANNIERRCNQRQRYQGVLAWALAVLPISSLVLWLDVVLQNHSSALYGVAQSLVLYLCIGWQSLKEHMRAIHQPLQQGNLEKARYACSMVVSRDTSALNENQLAQAAVESTLENGNDGIFAALFWFALLGMPGVVLYRLANTLDAMWGYKTDRYLWFGWCAAKLDDLLNWVPARMTALVYCLYPFLQNTSWPQQRQAIHTAFQRWREQASELASPNGGPVMVTGASVLNLKLGGPTRYHGQLMDKPFFGGELPATPDDIVRALALVRFTTYSWVIMAALMASFFAVFTD